MIVTYCDITKKPIKYAKNVYSWEARRDRYETLLNKDLSVAGVQKLEEEVIKTMEKKPKFNFMAYKSLLQDKLKQLSR